METRLFMVETCLLVSRDKLMSLDAPFFFFSPQSVGGCSFPLDLSILHWLLRMQLFFLGVNSVYSSLRYPQELGIQPL